MDKPTDIEAVRNLLNLAEVFRRIRSERGYSQHAVAYALGVSQNAYSKIELKGSRVCFQRALELSDIFEVDLGDIIKAAIDGVEYMIPPIKRKP